MLAGMNHSEPDQPVKACQQPSDREVLNPATTDQTQQQSVTGRRTPIRCRGGQVPPGSQPQARCAQDGQQQITRPGYRRRWRMRNRGGVAVVLADPQWPGVGEGRIVVVMPCGHPSVVLRQVEIHPRAWRRMVCGRCQCAWRLEFPSETATAWTLAWSEARPRVRRRGKTQP
jgi:hypothetical protein